MIEHLVALATFLGLVLASFGCLVLHPHLPERHRNEETHAVVRLTANIFVVMTSLVLGLLINSSKTAFDAIDHNVHAFATELILLDRTLRAYGPDTADARVKLALYVERAIEGTWPTTGEAPVVEDVAAERLLDNVGAALRELHPTDNERAELKIEWRQRFQKIIELRWALIEHWDGTVPAPLLAVLTAWLTLIFASFSYRAPANAIVVSTLVVGAALISSALFLILDMDSPFTGSIRVSPTAMETALAHIRR